MGPPAAVAWVHGVKLMPEDVKFRLGEGSLHGEDKTIVEFGGIVTAFLVDHEGAGDGTHFQKAMPILVRAGQARGFQREDRGDLFHRHIADQRLEVLAPGGVRAGLAEIPVEDGDPLRPPHLHAVAWTDLGAGDGDATGTPASEAGISRLKRFLHLRALVDALLPRRGESRPPARRRAMQLKLRAAARPACLGEAGRRGAGKGAGPVRRNDRADADSQGGRS